MRHYRNDARSSVTIAMTQRPLRVLIIASHPVQYESPILRLLEQDPRVESEVAYCSLQGAEPGIDPDFGVEVKWDIPLLDGYQWSLIRNRSWAPRIGAFFGLLNVGIWRKIRRGKFRCGGDAYRLRLRHFLDRHDRRENERRSGSVWNGCDEPTASRRQALEEYS